MTTLTRANIVKEVCKQLRIKQNNRKYGGKVVWLFKGKGYWWFMYNPEDCDKTIYETQSIYVMYLKDMRFEDWVSDGVNFVNRVRKRI